MSRDNFIKTSKISRWLQSLWYLRGTFSAIALAGMVPNFVDMSRYEFLRLVHALIVGWNIASEVAAKFLSSVMNLPEFRSATINGAILIFTTVAPGIFAIFHNQLKDAGRPRSKIQILAAGIMGAVIIVLLLVLMSYETEYYYDDRYDYTSDFSLLFALMVCFAFAISFSYFVEYRHGVIHLAMFVITLQILYYLSLPGLVGILESFSDSVLGPQTID